MQLSWQACETINVRQLARQEIPAEVSEIKYPIDDFKDKHDGFMEESGDR